MRSPIDVACIGKLLGLNDHEARETMQANCVRVFQHAHYRKTHKGVAELVELPVGDSSDDHSDEEMKE